MVGLSFNDDGTCVMMTGLTCVEWIWLKLGGRCVSDGNFSILKPEMVEKEPKFNLKILKSGSMTKI